METGGNHCPYPQEITPVLCALRLGEGFKVHRTMHLSLMQQVVVDSTTRTPSYLSCPQEWSVSVDCDF
uniref:Uncharacterized protein n=1 Tax=Magallana gigas TaxID=29159 RepID=K1QW60_MAGGI